MNLAAGQIRIHNSTGCDFYLVARSRPIIEECDRLRFAPYAFEYTALQEHLAAAGLPGPTSPENTWDQVEDFEWLKAGVPSPHWSLLPEAERATVVRPPQP